MSTEKKMHSATGKVIFNSLESTDVYNNQDTGKYYVTVALDDASVDQLEKQGVKLKTYTHDDGRVDTQKKFDTKFHVPVRVGDAWKTAEEFRGDIPFGSVAKVGYTLGEDNKEHGVKAYLNIVRIIDLADSTEADDEF